MSVTQLKQEFDLIQTEFSKYKEECVKQFKKAYDLENEFMNTFEDLNTYVSDGTKILSDLFAKHIELVNNTVKLHENNKFEEGNFNRVSIIKKQDDTIKTLEIKVAELEMRLANAEKNGSRQSIITIAKEAEPIPNPTTLTSSMEHQCYARVGKAKYNISKQAPEFMNDFPEGPFITKTGCVVGLPCTNTVVLPNVLFCPEHNTGKFEDIRTEPGTLQVPIIPTVHETTSTEPQPQVVEKKKATPRKKKDVVTAVTTTIVIPEPVKTVQTEEPTQAEEPAQTEEPTQAEESTQAEQIDQMIGRPLNFNIESEQTVLPELVQAEEPIEQMVGRSLNLNFEMETQCTLDETMLDEQNSPLSPIVDIDMINQLKSSEPVISIQEPEKQASVQEIKTNMVIEPPSFDDIEFYDEPVTGKTYYLDSKTRRIFEIAPNDEIGVFVKQL